MVSNEKQYTTVLWDLDGTILNSAAGVYNSFRKTFETLGLPAIPDEQLRTFLGPPLHITFGYTLGFDAELTEKCLDTYRDIYLGGQATNAEIFPGVLELIADCKAAGLTNAMATSKGYSGVLLAGEHFGFLPLFDVLGTASADVNRFSKTDVLSYALGELREIGADLSRVVLIGDRIHDVEGARDHGIEVGLVKWGFGTEEEWAQADFEVENVESLRQVLLPR